MKINAFTLMLVFLIFLAGCKTTPHKKQIPKQVTYLDESTNTFILFLKEKLPLVHEEMTRHQVDNFLEFNKRFNGIITSGGDRNNFKYYYHLSEYKLILSFNYDEDKEGKFISYQLTPTS